MIDFANRFYEGVKVETFYESCGVADLITTCYAGRNRRAGEEFVKTKKVEHYWHISYRYLLNCL
jgi:glycerol-3-phosphate dehydrogenase (NAD+)